MDYYEVLGLSRNCTEEEIKKSYRKLAKDFHPDRNPGDTSVKEKFEKVANAYEVLSDPQKRAYYDRTGSRASSRKPPSYSQQSPFTNVSDLFNNARNSSSQRKGKDFHSTIEVTLKEVAKGVKKKIIIPQKIPCKKCEGRGFTEYKPCEKCSGSGRMFVKKHPFNISAPCNQCSATGRSEVKSCEECSGNGNIKIDEKSIDVDLPIGTHHGMQIRLAGAGDPLVGGSSGDAIFHVIIKEHDFFTRDGLNVVVEVPVSYAELVLGIDIVVPCVDGKKVNISIPKGTQFDSQFKVKRMGLPSIQGLRGDMYVTLKMQVPDNPSPEYKEVMDKLLKLDKDQIDRSFLKDF